jgi:hypothetical protein
LRPARARDLPFLVAARSVTGTGGAGPTFSGYFGVQILLKDYGRSLVSE